MKKHIFTTLFLLILGAGYWWYYNYNKKESEKYDRYREIINREDSIKNIKDSACDINLSSLSDFKFLDLNIKFPCGWTKDTVYESRRPIKYYTVRGTALLTYLISVIKVEGKFKSELYDSATFRRHIMDEYKGDGIINFSKITMVNKIPIVEITISKFEPDNKGFYNTIVTAFPHNGFAKLFIGMVVSESKYESETKFNPFAYNIYKWATLSLPTGVKQN